MRSLQIFLAADVMPFSERASEALKVSLLGLGTIFAVLGALWLVLELFRIVFTKTNNGPKKSKTEAVKNEAPKVEVAPKIENPPAASVGTDYSVIAAISAAVAAVLESECAASGTVYNGFRIVSVKRGDKGRSWTQKN